MGNKKAILTRFGGPEVIEVVEDARLPEPAPGEVRIQVEASSALSTDTVIRKGIYPLLKDKPPFALGYDLVGVVDELGPGVTSVRVGQRVADLLQIGGNAEYVVRPEAGLIPVLDSVDATEAACLVLSWMTAYQMLIHAAGVRPGQKVLVQGGSGAVGTALVQLGRHLGLEVVATASARKLDLVEAYGATAVDYRAPGYDERLREAAGEGFDAAFDAIGLASFRRSHRLLKRGGTLVTYGTFGVAASIDKKSPAKSLLFGLNYFAMLAALRLWTLLPGGKSARFFGIVDSHDEHFDRFSKDLGYLLGLLAAGEIRPVVAERLSLDDAARAHEMLDGGSPRGQLVFAIDRGGER